MYLVNLELTPKDIVDKDFPTSLRGFNPKEVDLFLDIIIRDYESFLTEVSHLSKMNQELETENKQLKDKLEEQSQELNEVQHQMEEQPVQVQSAQQDIATNFDILKRLSNLERHVFGNKLNNNVE